MKAHPVYTRRDFLRTSSLTGLGLAAINSTVPSFLTSTASAADAPKGEKVLVVLQLSGGNDGLNTVVPFGDDAYYNARPIIGIKPGDVIKIGAGRYKDYLGFNSTLKALMPLWENGTMAVINGVGYPNPNRSHFRAMEIWHTAVDSSHVDSCGWLGRYFDNACQGCGTPDRAVNFGHEIPQALMGELKLASTSASAEDVAPINFLARTPMNAQVSSDKTRELLAKSKANAGAYPDTQFANGLAMIANMIAGGHGARVYYHDQSGFDTHANQLAAHARLWNEVSEGIAAFFGDLEKRGLADRVLVMSFSEFGRRLAENGAYGTDHGAAAPMFIWGKAVQGGVYGKPPSLTELDHGDLKSTVDFRSVYATVLDGWLGANHKTILGRQFAKLPFVIA